MIRKRKRRIGINKKGSLPDLVFLGGALLAVALSILFGFLIMSNINDEFQASDTVTNDGKVASQALNDHFPGIIDNSFLFLIVGVALATLALAALVRVHPIFIPFFLIGLIFVVFLSGIFSNIYQEVAQNPSMVVYSSQLTFITTVLTLLPLFIAVFGIIMMVVMYKLWSVET